MYYKEMKRGREKEKKEDADMIIETKTETETNMKTETEKERKKERKKYMMNFLGNETIFFFFSFSLSKPIESQIFDSKS